jgi:hypothetical protein
MCVQAVCLIQAEIERNEIATVSISLLREVSEVLQPPRALFVPFRLGFPLGEPYNSSIQNRVISSALHLLSREDAPLIADL